MNYLRDVAIGNLSTGYINVVVEIPKGSRIKYEVDASGMLITPVRELHRKFKYPFNYGMIPKTLAPDNDPLDVIILGADSISPGVIVKCKVIGEIKTVDNNEEDNKILVIPQYLSTYRDSNVKEAMKFLSRYKYPFQKGTVVDNHIYDAVTALNDIITCSKRYSKENV